MGARRVRAIERAEPASLILQRAGTCWRPISPPRIQTRVLSVETRAVPPRLIPRVTPQDENERAGDSRPD